MRLPTLAQAVTTIVTKIETTAATAVTQYLFVTALQDQTPQAPIHIDNDYKQQGDTEYNNR